MSTEEQSPSKLYLSQEAAEGLLQRMNVTSFPEALQKYPVGYLIDAIILETREYPNDPWSVRVFQGVSAEATLGGVIRIYQETSLGTLDAHMEFWQNVSTKPEFELVATLRVPPGTSLL